MLNFDKIYLVRHGSYERYSQELSAAGIEQSERAGQQLLSAGAKREVTVLSSDAQRALQTSTIIASILETTVMPSKRINVIGNEPGGVGSLDEMVEIALAEAGAKPEGESLIVVTHQPLLQIAAFGAKVANGQIVEYQPQTWNNPEFSERAQQYLLGRLGAAGLDLGSGPGPRTR